MHLDNYFDKVYCINLRSRKDRWLMCEEEFKLHGIGPVKRIEGVEGIPAGLQGYSTMGLDPTTFSFQAKLAGRIGCLSSHLKVLTDAKRNKFKKILILEDDVQFSKDFKDAFEEGHKHIPEDWKMLYFGGNEKGKASKVNENIIRVSHMLMAHAVGVCCSVFDELIRELKKHEEPVDVTYAAMQKKFPCYSFYPYLAWQRADWSDIEQRYRIYDLENQSPYLQKMLNAQ
jgi:GR25 family glycosyltransferase involved in LPS biosynthesis